MATEKNREEADPRTRYPQPPYPQPQQRPPGQEAKMHPTADHGEESYKGSGKLKGKVALITGADSGIGRAVALAFAREGADVAIAYLDQHEDAQATAKLVEEAGQRALLLPGDIGEERHCQMLVEKTRKELGGLHILVNNAAFQRNIESIEELDSEMLERTFRTNIFGPVYLCKAALPQMPAGGNIINTVSIQAYQPSGSLLAYAATKGALVNFTKGLVEEAMKKGVRVNAVAPGPVWTPLIPSTLPPERVQKFGQDTPLQRAAQPAELAPVFVLLASDEASFITGAVYAVTGGEITA